MTLAPLLLLAACASKGPPPDLGALAADAAPLESSPSLAYLPAAMEGEGPATAQDLFDPAGQPWAHAADPTAYLTSVMQANPEPADDAVPLSVLTYNVALLDARLLKLIPYKQSPYLDERRPELPALILDQGHDIVLLQEVWNKPDLKRFEEAAEARGYLSFHGPRARYTDGTVTFIKAELVAEGSTPTVHAEPYVVRDGLEHFPGVNIKRGFVVVSFEHPTLGTMHVYNTHLMAWASLWMMRESQVRQLGAHMAANTGEGELTLAGGDFNAGVYYPRDEWVSPDGTEERVWWDNTLSYSLMAHYSGAQDLWLRGAHPTTVLSDIGMPDRVMNDPALALTNPHVEEGWCAENHPVFFSATDCNAMYFMQYGGTEYPARMDLLWAIDPTGRISVQSTELAFTERVRFGDLEPVEPSDHLAVQSSLLVAPPRR